MDAAAGAGRAERAREIGRLLRRVPSYIQAERRDRGGLLRAVYRRYKGADLAEFEEPVADECSTPHVLERLVAGGGTPGPRAPRGRAHRRCC